MALASPSAAVFVSAPSWRAVLGALAVACVLAACGGGAGDSASSPAPGSAAADDSGLSDAALLGQRMFRDVSLSASGKMACISCHDPATGHAAPFETPVASGGPNLDQQGIRNAPSLRYLRFNTSFHFADDGTPTGGFFWDGRANSLHEQALGPLLDPREMANRDVAAVVAKLAAATYADDFRKLFGDGIFASPQDALDRAGYALERYQVEDPEFASFSSKYDAFVAGNAKFTAQELNGFALFNRGDKGNCAACHSSTKPANAPGALFTDFSYDNLGVPRNAAIAANAHPGFHDLGLCGGTRTDLASRMELCGAFKVPSLRNVALRKHFFHNGVFDSLEQVIRFYVQRDTHPQLWYPADATGQVTPYDDLPASVRKNVNTTEVPYNRRPGQAPALTEAEVQDVASFLRTLTDGYTP
jgi:cytochrome c peroxidase